MQKTDISQIMELYGNMLYRTCFVILRNNADTEDAVQEVLLTYLTKAPQFENTEHEKAWLLTVAVHKCRDIQRQRMRCIPMEVEMIRQNIPDKEECHILEALMRLPEKFRIVMTLHYVEGYKVNEIADIIGKSSSAVKMRLSKGRHLLEEIYRKEFGTWI